jgi:RNA polymerase sigma factor (sigma-70 family)
VQGSGGIPPLPPTCAASSPYRQLKRFAGLSVSVPSRCAGAYNTTAGAGRTVVSCEKSEHFLLTSGTTFQRTDRGHEAQMATANLSDFLRRLTCGMAAETFADYSDQQLVERALAGCGEPPLQAIVHRHGPMVYRVCRRVLQHRQDAEDAFQATFLILAQKLRTVRKHASLASWLHGVARRVTLKAKAQSAARLRHEHRALPSDTLPSDDVTWGELRSALDSELSQLPDKWRLPLILCYLEGRTQEESARQLGWSKSTLRRRLEEARTALGGRLTRRGIAWSAAISAILLSDCIASAAPAPGLVASTVEAAAGIAAGKTVAKAVSATVAALTEGVLKTMLLITLKTVTAVLVVALGVLLGGSGLFHHETIAAQQAKPSVEKGKPESPQPELKTDKRSGSLQLEGLDLVKETIKGSRVETNPERTFFSHRQESWELLVKPTTKITIDGKDAKLGDLEKITPRPGIDTRFVFVEAELEVLDDPKQSKRKGLAIRIDATGMQVRCVVQAINVGKNTVIIKKMGRGFDGDVVSEDGEEVPFAKDVQVTINDRPATLGELKSNMKLSLQMSAVKELVLGIKAYGATVEGVLKTVDTAKDAVSVTIPSAQMTAEGVSVAKYAKVVIDGKEGKLSDLKTGMRVTLQMSAEPEQSVIIGITKEKSR